MEMEGGARGKPTIIKIEEGSSSKGSKAIHIGTWQTTFHEPGDAAKKMKGPVVPRKGGKEQFMVDGRQERKKLSSPVSKLG